MNTPSRSRLRLVGKQAAAADLQGEIHASAAPEDAGTNAQPPRGEDRAAWTTTESTRTSSVPPSRARRVAVSTLCEMPDKNLVALALAGELLAKEALYRKHVSFAMRVAIRIEGSSRDVEDIVHDAFVKVLTRLQDLTDPSAFRSWLGSIVVFAVRSRMRRARLMNALGLGRTAEPVDLDALMTSDASPHVRAQLAQVYALLRTLPTDDRIAWTLRCVDGNELEVVARLVQCSLATVKRRVSRVQQFLEEHFVDSNSQASK